MLSEFRKSINSILFERVTSPLFGALTISWLIWNWKIVYLTLFIDESKIDGTKIDYILLHFSDINFLITYPVISTVVLITIIPFISNGAYWLSLIFKKWKIDKKNEIEKTQLLSVEQSVNLRKELREKEYEFEKILEKKNTEEELLKSQIKDLIEKSENEQAVNKTKKIPSGKRTSSSGGGTYSSSEYSQLKANKKAFEPFQKVAESIRNNFQFPEEVSDEIREYYLINEIVKKEYDSDNDVYYELTFKGKSLYKDLFNEKF